MIELLKCWFDVSFEIKCWFKLGWGRCLQQHRSGSCSSVCSSIATETATAMNEWINQSINHCGRHGWSFTRPINQVINQSINHIDSLSSLFSWFHICHVTCIYIYSSHMAWQIRILRENLTRFHGRQILISWDLSVSFYVKDCINSSVFRQPYPNPDFSRWKEPNADFMAD